MAQVQVHVVQEEENFGSETPGSKKAKCEGSGGPPPLFDVMALLEFDAGRVKQFRCVYLDKKCKCTIT